MKNRPRLDAYKIWFVLIMSERPICVSVWAAAAAAQGLNTQAAGKREGGTGIRKCEQGEKGYYDNRGENVPGDSEIVEMLIVHSQSSIKFNSHSAATCYSNSVTEDTSRMYSYFSLSLSLFIRNDNPILPSHPFASSSSFLLSSWAERGRICK